MSRKEKMLKIIEMFRAHPSYKFRSHVMVKYGDDIITFYDDGDDYFVIMYDNIEVNINGTIQTPGLDFVFDLDEWLVEVDLVQK